MLPTMGLRGSFKIEICHFGFIVVCKSMAMVSIEDDAVIPTQMVMIPYIKDGYFVKRSRKSNEEAASELVWVAAPGIPCSV